jgi:anti-sigma B factor antagonist
MTMALEETWHWRVDVGADRIVLTLSGEIDMSGADGFEHLLREMIGQARAVEVDMEQLSFIDSTVLGALVAAHHEALDRGVDLTVVKAAGQVRRVLDMTGIMQLLDGAAPGPPVAF